MIKKNHFELTIYKNQPSGSFKAYQLDKMFRPVIEKGLGSNLSQECCSLTRDVVGRKPQMKPSCVTHLTV